MISIASQFRQLLYQARYLSTGNVKRTCLFSLHQKYEAKLAPFAGFEMPVQYPDLSISESAIHTRKYVSIFDVSHMLQTYISGTECIPFVESLTTGDIFGLKNNHGCLSVFTNEKGGIKDDLIVSKINENLLYMVTNAGCIDKDLPYLLTTSESWRNEGKDVTVKVCDDKGLIAVQGPQMIQLLQPQVDFQLDKLNFMHSIIAKVCGIENCRITRCGYTGEDGVEISVQEDRAVELVECLLGSKHASARLAGLGARDVLRLEAGLCLYGNDISENTTPLEADLAFVVAKRRRKLGNFPGASKIMEQIELKNWPKRRVGIISDTGRPPRSHVLLVNPDNNATVGFITSGCPSPNLKKNIAMAYVDRQDAVTGRQLLADFGGKRVKVTICKMPFVPTSYYVKK